VTQVRVLATHDIVQAVHPRPVTDVDRVGMAVGRAIDSSLAQFNFESRQSRRPTLTAMNRGAAARLEEELAETDVDVPEPERERLRAQIAGVVQAFRGSEVFGLLRPRSRLILIGEEVGVYAQPDFWNGKDRIYEMKSYSAVPPPPDVALQLGIFQLAFPQFRTILACFDRHARPVTVERLEVPPLSAARSAELVAVAYRTGRALGQPKVLEYLDSPTVRYAKPAEGPPEG
jgi:hypothetical protein